MTVFDYIPRTRVVSGPGVFSKLGGLARELGFRRTLLVADAGLAAAGWVDRARRVLEDAGIVVFPFHGFDANPTTAMVEEGRRFAEPLAIDSLAALGGGSSLDCAKGVNFVLTNGGSMRDYWGYGKAARPLLPMIGVPTTSGTGSEAQSYALISDAETHVKMACGDPQAAFRLALLDPLLTASAPFAVRAAAGYDAISHAVETAVTTRRNAISRAFSRQAWDLLEANFERVLDSTDGVEALGALQTGAYLAGAAIENSMLGAAHAAANPLTGRYGTPHGAAIALMLPHAVRFNQPVAEVEYRTLYAGNLAQRLEELARAARLPARLRDIGVPRDDLPVLARDAAPQWTGRFNPRPFDESAALELYQHAW